MFPIISCEQKSIPYYKPQDDKCEYIYVEHHKYVRIVDKKIVERYLLVTNMKSFICLSRAN